MKIFRPLFFLLITFGVTASSPVFSQVPCNLLQASTTAAAAHAYAAGYWFGVIYKASKGA